MAATIAWPDDQGDVWPNAYVIIVESIWHLGDTVNSTARVFKTQNKFNNGKPHIYTITFPWVYVSGNFRNAAEAALMALPEMVGAVPA